MGKPQEDKRDVVHKAAEESVDIHIHKDNEHTYTVKIADLIPVLVFAPVAAVIEQGDKITVNTSDRSYGQRV